MHCLGGLSHCGKRPAGKHNGCTERPSDTQEALFEKAIIDGFEFVEKNNALLTLGIKPTRPETGYGYIQVGQPVEGGFFKVKTFTEKPKLELAEVFVESGEFFWNSGIFLWKAHNIIEELKQHAPDVADVFESGKGAYGTPAEREFINRAFPGCVGISIDFAVMEKSRNVFVECVSFGWSDLGTWSALYDNSPKNRDSNVTQNCNVLAYNAEGNIFAVNGEKLIVVDGLKDYIVADSGDVLLVCPKGEEQRIKQMVNDVHLAFGEKYL